MTRHLVDRLSSFSPISPACRPPPLSPLPSYPWSLGSAPPQPISNTLPQDLRSNQICPLLLRLDQSDLQADFRSWRLWSGPIATSAFYSVFRHQAVLVCQARHQAEACIKSLKASASWSRSLLQVYHRDLALSVYPLSPHSPLVLPSLTSCTSK
jgi:hypothetical protein